MDKFTSCWKFHDLLCFFYQESWFYVSSSVQDELFNCLTWNCTVKIWWQTNEQYTISFHLLNKLSCFLMLGCVYVVWIVNIKWILQNEIHNEYWNWLRGDECFEKYIAIFHPESLLFILSDIRKSFLKFNFTYISQLNLKLCFDKLTTNRPLIERSNWPFDLI